MSKKINWIYRNLENEPFARLLRFIFPIFIIAASLFSLFFSKNGIFDVSDAFNIIIIIASTVDVLFAYQDKIFSAKDKSEEERQNDIATRNFVALFVTLIIIPILILMGAKLP